MECFVGVRFRLQFYGNYVSLVKLIMADYLIQVFSGGPNVSKHGNQGESLSFTSNENYVYNITRPCIRFRILWCSVLSELDNHPYQGCCP